MAVVPYITKDQRDDILRRMILTKSHIGTNKVDKKMAPHVFGRAAEGHHIINIEKTVERIALAARVIAAIPNPRDVCVVGSRQEANRPVMKFAHYTGASPAAGRWTPGTLTNQITKQFQEPRVVVVADPVSDAQAIAECSRANICVIALCDADSPLTYVDIVIPCNNRSAESIGLIFWLLTREYRYLRGLLPRYEQWEVMPDFFFHREAVEETPAMDDAIVGDQIDDEEAATNTDAVPATGVAAQAASQFATDQW